MKDDQATERIVRFGVFEVDLKTGELRKSGIRIKLAGPTFSRSLAMLLRTARRGRHTGRASAEDSGPMALLSTYEHSINAAIKKLRQMRWATTAETTRVFVETLARRGYRFIAPLEEGRSISRRKSLASAGLSLGRHPTPAEESQAFMAKSRQGGRNHLQRWRSASWMLLILAAIGIAFL